MKKKVSAYFMVLLYTITSGCGGGAESSNNSLSNIDLPHKSSEKVIRANWENVNKPGESSLGVLKKSLDNSFVEIELQKGSKVGEHIQFFIDSDYNEATGYRDIYVNGADYLIEDGRLYKSTANDGSWSWQRVGNVEFLNESSRIYAKVETDRLDSIKDNFRVAAISSDGNQEWHIVSNIYMKPIDRKIITVDTNLDDWSDIDIFAKSNMGNLKIVDDLNSIYFMIEKGDLGKHVQIYIDSDNSSLTGYSSDILGSDSGADFLIEDGRLYKSTADGSSWSWQRVGSVEFAKDNNIVEIGVKKSDLDIDNSITSIRVGAVGWDAQYDNHISDIKMKQNIFVAKRGLVINEVMVSNAHTLMDPDFYKFSDWIEIYNESSHQIDMSNFKLGKDLEKGSWTIPNKTTIPPSGYMIFWADKKDIVQNGYHTDFSLKSKGGEVALFDTLGQRVDGFSYKKLKPDVSINQKDGKIVYMNPTPNRKNSSYIDRLSLSQKPTFSKGGGFYSGSVYITLSADNGAKIYYTTDGSFPTLNSKLYQGENIEITKTTVIRARALEDGKIFSVANTQTYLIDEDINLPVISLATDESYLFDDEVGIYTIGTNGAPSPGCNNAPRYANYFQDWKRPANIEYFTTNKELGFSQEFDIKISGSCSPVLAQKSLSVKADSKYGEKSLKYKLFPHKDITKFKGFKIKSAGQDWEGTMLRDAFMHQVVRGEMDVDYQDYRACVLFINGKYWGIHNIREKKNEDFLAENHPQIDPDEVDILEDNGGINEGSNKKYKELITFIENNSLADENNYNEIASKIDIENYIDYIVAETYFANSDWPYTNVRFYRDQNGGKWRWILEDLDLGLGGPWGDEIDINMLEMLTQTENLSYQNPLWSTFLFRSLIKNDTFKARFKEKYQNYLNTTFKTDRVLSILNSMVSTISPQMQRHATRWKDSSEIIYKDRSDWERKVDRLREIIEGRNQRVTEELNSF